MIAFGAILALCVAGVVVRNRSLKLLSLHPSELTLALAFGSAVGGVLASAILFVSYWPYSHALQRFISAGDESGLLERSRFLSDARVPLGTVGFLGVPNAVFYFWFGVAIL